MGLDSVELVMSWEEHFDIKITDKMASTWLTPRIAIDSIEIVLNRQSGAGRVWTRAEIERDVCLIIAEQTGLSRQEFTLDSHFVRDMGID